MRLLWQSLASAIGRIGRMLCARSDRTAFPLVELHASCSGPRQMLYSRQQLSDCLRSLGPASDEDIAWARGECNPRPYVADLRRATVIQGSRIVISADGTALGDEIVFARDRFGLAPKRADMELFDGSNIRIAASRAISLVREGIHLTCEHERNYFHWVAEILPRLHLYERVASDPEVPLLVSDGLHPNQYRLLQLVRHEDRDVVKLPRGGRTIVRRLIYPADVSRMLDVFDRPPSLETVYLPVPLIRDMAARVKMRASLLETQTPERIFLVRSSSYRNLLNSGEVQDRLALRGFVQVDTGQLSADAQIALFSRARYIIGSSGAAFANLAWCSPGARVLVLHSDHPFKRYPYLDALARASGAGIGYLAGRRANRVSGRYAAHDDFTVELKSLDAATSRLVGPAWHQRE